MRHRGGGHKRRYRIIDFKQDKFGIYAKVAAVEYRSQPRALDCPPAHYVDGEKRYILAPDG